MDGTAALTHQRVHPRPALAGDLWGGLAAMLVAMPSAIAFGVTIYAPLGGAFPAFGALAGILGATAIGLVAAALGGTQRLISAPCAPAAAVLSAFAIESVQHGVPADRIVLLMTVIALGSGAIQVAIGTAGLGRLIKYMPYPVVSGYLSGVGLIIIGSQLPKLLGAPRGMSWWRAAAAPGSWSWQAAVVGGITVAVMLFAPRITKAVPAAILALIAGAGTYFALGAGDPRLLVLGGNPLVIGPLGGGSTAGGGMLATIGARWGTIGGLSAGDLLGVAMPALSLAMLLSIDTLKTCVVLDTVTRSRHDSNRELLGQGCANIVSAGIGGIPGAGTMGATMVNIASGGQSRRSGMLAGAFALVAFLLLRQFIAWVPVAALAGILVVVGARMIDRQSLHFLRARSTALDFAVVAAVVVTALTVDLVLASGVGVALAILLFTREQLGGRVVLRHATGATMFSRRVRNASEMAVLRAQGEQTAIFELQGSLFFGTTDQLYAALAPELDRRRWVILDLRRVQAVDVTAAHMLEQVRDTLTEHGGQLLFSDIPRSLPSGRDIAEYLQTVGLAHERGSVRLFDELDGALEWTEDQLLAESGNGVPAERPLTLVEMDLFAGRSAETLADLEQCMMPRSVRAGESILAMGDTGDDLFLVRRGAVRVSLPLAAGQAHHLGTFGRGSFLGEMAFLDRAPRSADATAIGDVELYALSRESFDRFAEEHRRASLALLEALARALATRLRYTNAELQELRQ